MQSIIMVYEENHGFLCAANDFYSAVQYLIENNWLTDDMEFFDWDTGNTVPLKSFFPNYKEIILNEWDIEKFNTFFYERRLKNGFKSIFSYKTRYFTR